MVGSRRDRCRWAWQVVMALALLAGTVGAPRAGAAQGALRLGVPCPQTGNAATTGRFMTDGYVVAIKELNDRGGVAGRKIDHEIFNTVGDPQSGINAFNRFVAGGYRFGLIGFSAVITAVGPLADKENLLLVNSGAPPFDPSKMGANTIHTLNGQDHEMVKAARYAYEKMGARNVGFVYADIAANFAGVKKFAATFEQLGGKVAGFEGAPQGAPDFRSLLIRLKQKNPDLIYIYTFGPDPGNVMKQMKELGMTSVRTMGYSGAAVPQTFQVGGAAAEGFVATSGYFDPASRDPQTEQYLASYRKYLNPSVDPKTLGFYHATTYDGMMMLAMAMEKVAKSGGNPEDPKAVRNAFYEVGRFPAVTGTAVYTAGNSVPRKPFQVLEVKGGQFVPIDKLDID